MTDWQYQNGNLLMMIRDTGSNVEFWVQTDQYTFNNDQNWSYYANGATHSFVTAMAKNAWTRLGYVSVTTDQTVNFTVIDEGLGFPTHTFSHLIDRVSPPSAPAKPILTVRSNTTIELDLGADGANNGAAIDSRQYAGHSTNTTTGATIVTASNNYQWTGLAAGTTYYFWQRTHNAKGYSPWSPVASAKTSAAPSAPSMPALSNVTDTTVDVSFADGADNGLAIDDREITYGIDPNVSQYVFPHSTGSSTITGLTPGTSYYFWAREHNASGWGPYSAKASIATKRPPDAPSAPDISESTPTSVRAVFSDNGDGGAPITAHRLGWSTDGAAPPAANVVDSDRDQVLTGLPPDTLVYFFARAQNMYGWSPWSVAKLAQTAAGAWVYDLASQTWHRAVPWVKVNGVWTGGKPWVKIAGVWKGTR